MFRGTVSLTAAVSGLSFARFEFTPPHNPGVPKIEIESADGGEIRALVHVTGVPDDDEAERLATAAFDAVADQLAFQYQVAVENSRCGDVHLTPIDPAPNTLYASTGRVRLTGHSALLAIGLSRVAVERLKQELESPAPVGQAMYGLFRIAMRAVSPIEKFLLLYHILLALLPDDKGEDSQREVDAFIRQEQPGVACTPHPRWPQTTETIYSRLRNEIAHRRPGVDLKTTRSEIDADVGGLVNLAKRAIETRG